MGFKYENGIVQALMKIADCAILSGLWILCSIPIFTIGASSTALYYASVKGLRREIGYSSKQFLKAFKSNFKRSTHVWLIGILLYGLGITDSIILYKLVGESEVIKFLFITMLVMLLLITVWVLYVFPYIARFENTTKAIMKNCALIMIANLPWSALLLIILAALIVLTYYVPVVGFFVPGIYIWIASFILEGIFQKYMTEEDLEAELEERRKKIMRKSILSILVTMCLVATCISGCQANEPTTAGKEQSNEEKKEFILKDAVTADKVLQATTEEAFRIPYPGETFITQGGYTDGKYYWQATLVTDKESGELNNEVYISKVDMATKKVVQVSDMLRLNHANDFVLNSNTGYLYCVNATGRKNIISVIDPETLTVVKEIDLGFEIFCLDYNEKTDKYIVGLAGGQSFQILDSNFQVISEVYEPTTRTVGYVTQGCTSDENYIYFALYKKNAITVYDWDGNYISYIELDQQNGEPENISVAGNDVYLGYGVGYQTGGEVVIYRITDIVPKE